jgi:hypothetical protein
LFKYVQTEHAQVGGAAEVVVVEELFVAVGREAVYTLDDCEGG